MVKIDHKKKDALLYDLREVRKLLGSINNKLDLHKRLRKREADILKQLQAFQLV